MVRRTKKVRTVLPRFRIYSNNDIALGPGKARLLKVIAERGSIQAAAHELSMSYMRAWKLVQTMNRCFKMPLIIAVRGGAGKGGARLTPTGIRVMSLYSQLLKTSLSATHPIWQQLLRLLR